VGSSVGTAVAVGSGVLEEQAESKKTPIIKIANSFLNINRPFSSSILLIILLESLSRQYQFIFV
jgi:hypothetical protein